MNNTKLRVGIIGLGQVSKVHERGYLLLKDWVDIVAMCDVDQQLSGERAAPYKAKVYTDFYEMVKDPDIDMIDITLPHHLHYEAAFAVLKEKKHVLVEKPIAVTSEKGLNLIKLAKDVGVKFTVAENTRFVKAYREAEKLIRARELGDIWHVRAYIHGTEINRLNVPSGWVGKKPYGGVILDSGVHTFYLFKWLFGGVREVQATASKVYSAGEMEDNAMIIGQLANGAEFMTLQSCTVEIPWMERLEVYGSHGGLVIDQLVNPPAKLYKGKMDWDGKALPGVSYDQHWKHNSMLEEVEDFVRAVRDNRDPLIDPMDGWYALHVAEAAYKSIEQNSTVSIS